MPLWNGRQIWTGSHGIIRGKGKNGKQKRRLTREEKKQIEAAIARANRTDKKEKSAQDSIPFEQMWPNGVCRLPDGRYSKTIQFQDINYRLCAKRGQDRHL